ncbi:hypothetical protein [Sedimenticola hydrogenitrophicus]|uniref:hypothetical protein n=1 Tax=Sedimenticola hydrogenitrophicus TaxID=2967975 RepID=UPI0023B10A39|nr:hypothetical protein [Sedimenticola hydrogenitrophicus]
MDSPIEKGISSSRRQFTKASLLASPVLMSVVSRPVFGVGCLSNMLSGNLSDPNRGECNLGLNPEYWLENPGAWPIAAGFTPEGTPPSSCSDCINGNGNGNGNWKCEGGALFNDYFLSGPQDALNRSMYEILCTDGSSDEFLIITALLNAMTDSNYVLSVEQVMTLWADPTLGGQIADFQSFLNSTWA